MACNSYFEHIFLNVLLRHLIRNPKAGIFFSEFWYTLLRSLIADYSVPSPNAFPRKLMFKLMGLESFL
jgi:hypothetical protein